METTYDILQAKMFKNLDEIKKFREDNLDWLDIFDIAKIEADYEILF